jgi:hypothetical protein
MSMNDIRFGGSHCREKLWTEMNRIVRRNTPISIDLNPIATFSVAPLASCISSQHCHVVATANQSLGYLFDVGLHTA